jgi:ASC-1-like (ASCH) protein
MRKIKASGAYSKIVNIRVQVLETVLSQIKNGEAINFNANKYLKRISDLRINKDKFTDLVSQISQETAEICLEFSAQQDIEIRKNIFSVSKKEIPEEIQSLAEFIYEEILFSRSYWTGLDE